MVVVPMSMCGAAVGRVPTPTTTRAASRRLPTLSRASQPRGGDMRAVRTPCFQHNGFVPRQAQARRTGWVCAVKVDDKATEVGDLNEEQKAAARKRQAERDRISSNDVDVGRVLQLGLNQALILSFALWSNQSWDALPPNLLDPLVADIIVGGLASLPIIAAGMAVDRSDNELARDLTRSTNLTILQLFGGIFRPLKAGAFALALSALVGVAEEISFRGIGLPVLTARLGSPVAGFFVSTSLFAIALEFGFGAWFALLYVTTGSLAVPIVAHAIYDFWTLFAGHKDVAGQVAYAGEKMALPGEGIAGDPLADKVAAKVAALQEKYELEDGFVKYARAAFLLMDLNKDGMLQRSEVLRGMVAFGIKPDDKELDALIRRVDDDGNNELDFGEMLELVVKLEVDPGQAYFRMLGR